MPIRQALSSCNPPGFLMIKPTSRQLQRPIALLKALRDDAIRLEQAHAEEIDQIEPSHRHSARNLLHYLSIRQHDIRDLQQDLSALGLSSLGVIEPHVLASLDAVMSILEDLSDQSMGPLPEPPVDFRTGPLLLRDHARALLGPAPQDRFVRIMVTMPSEAATDAQLVKDLLLAGMDVMRINCAHDGPDAWRAMVANLRQAERAVGRQCRIQADLTGPKLRTGRLRPDGRVMRLAPKRDAFGHLMAPGRIWLTPLDGAEPAPPECRYTLMLEGDLLANLQQGDRLTFSDTRGQAHCLKINGRWGLSCTTEIRQTAYVEDGTLLHAFRDEVVLGEACIRGLPEVITPILLRPGDTLILAQADEPGREALRDAAGRVIEPARIHCTLAAAFDQVKPGDSVWLDDGKIGGIVQANDGAEIWVRITHTGPQGSKLKAEKGINFPDTALSLSSLTAKDLEDLPVLVKLVGMVALSFVRAPEDVRRLHDELYHLGANHLGVVLKIENRQAFENLPHILFAGLGSPPMGVMIARGDLAVEVGFERLSEVQQEILWLCEAAHVPVIWATQILEGMAKKGAPSRAEVSDAAMSIMAECAMLNKGPNIVETVRFLDGVIGRMDEHFVKRRATLRKLAVAEFKPGGAPRPPLTPPRNVRQSEYDVLSWR